VGRHDKKGGVTKSVYSPRYEKAEAMYLGHRERAECWWLREGAGH